MAEPDAHEFDGLIVGAGHHGLILGCYMAKAGLDVAIVERRLDYGGALTTKECTLPGFYHNLHSINHFDITGTPWYRDLGLDKRVPYITPHYEFCQPHHDGRALVFSRSLDETCANIARFSEKDAATFREWNAKAEAITRDICLVERFSEPLSPDEREALVGRTAMGREFLDVCRRQPFDVVDELFENEHVKVLFLFKVSLFGTWLVDTLGKTSPMGSVIRAFDLETGYQLCKGGSHNLARGLMEVFVQAGGVFLNQAPVERITVEGGRATGLELTDGRALKARKFVASTADVHTTFDDFVGRDQLPAALAERVADHHYTRWTLFGVHYALNEAPAYPSAAFDPNVNVALKVNIGGERIEDLMNAHKQVQDKQIPDHIHFGAGALTAIDPSQAPPGKHTTYAWHVVPYDPGGDPDAIEAAKEEFADRIEETWRAYAPNMTKDNILARHIYTAYDYTREFPNMRQGDIFMGALSADQVMHNHFGYRSGIDGLYMAGSACHPGGAISGGAGYIAAKVIAEDLGLRPWWTPVDARAAFERAAAE